MKVLIIFALAVTVTVAMVAKNASNEDADNAASSPQAASETTPQESADAVVQKATANSDSQAEATKPLPRLVDLGAKKCIPCKMMAPILEELKQTHKKKFDVVFIDVWENQSAGEEYKIHLIPTQIFFDAEGKELFRHEGFFSKEEILAKWQELGISVADGKETEQTNGEQE